MPNTSADHSASRAQSEPSVRARESSAAAHRDKVLPFHGHDHLVQFYESDEFLCEKVADFLAEGLNANQPVVVIATNDHVARIREHLQTRVADFESMCRDESIIFLDAHATLNDLMRGDLPDPAAFETIIGGVLERALEHQGKSPHVRAFGEMVDLLWRAGNRRAAVRLEELWNDLAPKYPFSLLCGYAMDHFNEASDDVGFAEICGAHLHVVPNDRYARIHEPDARLREICRLQQRAAALERELNARAQLEKELREALNDRRRAEQALRESQAELKEFVENAAEGLHWVSAEGIILWANKAELELLGYSHDEYIGRHISEFHADRAVIEDMLARLSRNETLLDYEARLLTKGGSIKSVLINSNVFWRDGKFIHTCCFTRDITERKRAEEALRTAVEARNHVLAVVSHDLRNHLNSLLISAAMVQSLAGTGEETRSFRRPAEVILRSASRMTRLIEDLLDFDAIEHGRLTIRQEPEDPAAILEESLEQHSGRAAERGVMLIKGDCFAAEEVRCDRDRVLQVLDNLITNAINVTPRDGRITMKVVAGRPRRVVFSVEDTGPGIDPQHLSHIFDRYWRSDQDAYKGRGLGLAIARGIVDAHGGRIWAESTPGRGSTFFVELPC